MKIVAWKLVQGPLLIWTNLDSFGLSGLLQKFHFLIEVALNTL